MTINTTTRTASTRPLGRASLVAAAAALLVVASACGTETEAQAPRSTGAQHAQSGSQPWAEPAGDAAERLVGLAKARRGHDPARGSRRDSSTPQAQGGTAADVEPLYLPPTGRPVPLPGENE